MQPTTKKAKNNTILTLKRKKHPTKQKNHLNFAMNSLGEQSFSALNCLLKFDRLLKPTS